MPGLNGTGPMGMGSRTGRGLGVCSESSTDGYVNAVGGFGYGRRGSRSFGGGLGRGLGRGLGFRLRNSYSNNPSSLSTQEEVSALKAQSSSMQNALNEINAKIKALETMKG